LLISTPLYQAARAIGTSTFTGFGNVAIDPSHAPGRRFDGSQSIAMATVSGNRCPQSQGFWKSHTAQWPQDSLILGNQSYSKSELLNNENFLLGFMHVHGRAAQGMAIPLAFNLVKGG
jgi:hypothetical protein